ncbi:MAG: Mth938-like domain-containing protein [Magnetospirillum sp. WYHS-4]
MSGTTVNPLPLEGKPVVQSYGEGRFGIAGRVHEGSVLILGGEVRPWPAAEATLDTLAAVGYGPGILVVGCGARFTLPPAGLGEALKARGWALEWMDTGAACRTFNLLQSEDRPSAAALIAVE